MLANRENYFSPKYQMAPRFSRKVVLSFTELAANLTLPFNIFIASQNILKNRYMRIDEGNL